MENASWLLPVVGMNTPVGLCVAGLMVFMWVSAVEKMCPQPPTLAGR